MAKNKGNHHIIADARTMKICYRDPFLYFLVTASKPGSKDPPKIGLLGPNNILLMVFVP